MPDTLLLTPEMLGEWWGEKLSERVAERVRVANLRYTPLAQPERDAYLRLVVAKLFDPALDASGAHRLEKWETGWGENLKLLRALPAEKNAEWLTAIRPKYFNRYDAARVNYDIVKTAQDFEYPMLGIMLDWLFEKYLSDAPAAYEFGCGTGHNLMRLRHWNPEAKLVGLDWAMPSQAIIQELVARGLAENMTGRRFDFFNPDPALVLEPGSSVYSVAALEQTGTAHGPLVDFLVRQKPRLCLHIEPMNEFFEEDNLLDYLAIQYYKKRNYLWGFLDRLRELERAGTIEILFTKRTRLGHLMTDGYSVVAWRPV